MSKLVAAKLKNRIWEGWGVLYPGNGHLILYAAKPAADVTVLCPCGCGAKIEAYSTVKSMQVDSLTQNIAKYLGEILPGTAVKIAIAVVAED